MSLTLPAFLAAVVASFCLNTAEVRAAAPYTDAEIRSVQTEDEVRIADLRNQEITQLRIALGRRTPSNRRADLYLRLAEVYLEGYRSNFLLEGRVHEKRLEQRKADPSIDRSHSRTYLSAGIKACEDIIKLSIPYSKYDQVYYFLGLNYAELGKRQQSLKYFDLLTRKYPSSPFVADAYRELGDGAFDEGQYRKALPHYEAALRRNPGDARPRILHRLAWTYYRTKQYGKAIEVMKDAIAKASASGEKFLSLREEALRDMAVFMTEGGRVDEALAYFQNVAGDKNFYPNVLEKLGRQYERNAEIPKAVQVYETLLKTRPDDEAAFRVRAKLVDFDLRRGHYREALGRIRKAKLDPSGDQESIVAAQNLRAMIRRTGTELHERFRQKGNRNDLPVAEEYYTAYLNLFLAKDDPRNETPEIMMYLADVKRELGKSQEASALYRKVVDSNDKRYAKEAGALWTASLSDSIKKSTAANKGAAAQEPSALEREFVEAADALEDSLGNMPEGREAAVKAAQVLAGYRKTQKESIVRCRKIIANWPKSPQALTAARLWLQLLGDRVAEDAGAADEARDAIRELGENKVLLSFDHETGGGKLKATLQEHETRLKIKTIAGHEKEQDFQAAAKGYETLAKDAGSRELVEKAFSNAMAAYLKAGDFESLDRVSENWLKRFPGSAMAVESLRNSGTVALVQGKFVNAAALFEKAGKGGGNAESLLTAGRLFEGAGEVNRAKLAWSAYLTQYPQATGRWEVALMLGRAFETSHQDGDAAKMYKYCMSSPTALDAECGARLGDLYLNAKDKVQAKAAFAKVAALKKQGSPFIGYARYRLAEMTENETRFEKLQLPDAKLKKGINQRLEFVEPLNRAYLSAVDAGGPWAIAALDRLALWAFNFASEIDTIAPPAGADAQAIEKFRKTLSSVSDPLRKKAADTWAGAYQKAVASEVLSPAIPGIVDHLADWKLASPVRAQGFRGKFRLAGIPANGGSDGRDTALEKIRDRLAKNLQDAAAWVDYGNLLWGDGKPLLAKIAYERALSLDSKSAAALNNRGVIAVSGVGEEDWFQAAEGAAFFRDALKRDDFFVPAKMNRGALLNYYRLFSVAKPIWEQAAARNPSADAHDGLAVSVFGLGQTDLALQSLKKAEEAGADSDRFVAVFHQAVKQSLQGSQGAENCLDDLEDLPVAGDEAVLGFERASVENLRKTCTLWKNTSK